MFTFLDDTSLKAKSKSGLSPTPIIIISLHHMHYIILTHEMQALLSIVIMKPCAFI